VSEYTQVPSGSPVQPAGQPAEAGYVGASTASLRGEIRFLRVLLYGCLALLVLLTVSAGLALAALGNRLTDVQAQVAAAAAAAPAQPAAAPVQPAPAPTSAGLGPAAALTGVDLPAGVDPTGAILIGDPGASTVIETYIDYQCPFCQRWEAQHGTALIDRALQPGSGLLIKQYNMAFLGETAPTLDPAGASARAASAAACVVNHDGADVFATFSRSVFAAADPTEPPGQFTAAVLTDLARKAGASAAAIACIDAQTYVPFVAATTQSAFTRGVTGTPTVLIDGVAVADSFGDPRLAQLAAGS